MDFVKNFFSTIAALLWMAVRGILILIAIFVAILIMFFGVPYFISSHYGAAYAIYYFIGIVLLLVGLAVSGGISTAIMEAKALMYFSDKYDKSQKG